MNSKKNQKEKMLKEQKSKRFAAGDMRQKKLHFPALLATSFLFLFPVLGCDDNPPEDECEVNDDCREGYTCSEGDCILISECTQENRCPCEEDSDCPTDWYCTDFPSGQDYCVNCEGTIPIIVFNDQSGSIPAVCQPNTAGMIDYVSYLNEEKNGIYGCKVEWRFYDSVYPDPETIEKHYQEWQTLDTWNEMSTLFGNGTPTVQAIGENMNQDKKALIASSFCADYACPQDDHYQDISITSIVDRADPGDPPDFQETTETKNVGSEGFPWVFFPGTDYSTQARGSVELADSKSGNRIAMMYCTASTYCTLPVIAAKDYVNKRNQNNIESVWLARDLHLELGSDVSTLTDQLISYFQREYEYKDDHPDYEVVDWIWFGNPRTAAINFAQAYQNAVDYFATDNEEIYDNVETDLSDLKLVSNNWGVDGGVADALRPDDLCPACINNWYTFQAFPMYEDAPEEVHHVYETYRESSEFCGNGGRSGRVANCIVDADYRDLKYVYGFAMVKMWEAAYRSLVEQNTVTTPQEISGADIKDELETSGTDAEDALYLGDLGGLTAQTISFTPDDHRPQTKLNVYRLEEGYELVYQGDTNQIFLPARDEWLGW